MLDLSHEALLCFIEHNECDQEHPVIMDQVFGAEMIRIENKRKINSLKTRIRKLTSRAHGMSGFKLVNLDMKKADKIVGTLTFELFNMMSWNKVTTAEQASWKEYFHVLYDLIVSDYSNDHTGNVILARTVVKYHDVLKEPEQLSPRDNMFSMVSSIYDLFRRLKAEQVEVCRKMKDIKELVRDAQKQSTEIQHVIVALKRELKELENDNKKYQKIITWSVK